jgi:hypothetical protein
MDWENILPLILEQNNRIGKGFLGFMSVQQREKRHVISRNEDEKPRGY